MSRIIIADPHGCYKTLMALIAQLPAGVPITFAGDLIDRGPDSRKVIEFVKSGGYDCVQGNHEVMMVDELKFSKGKDGFEYPSVNGFRGIWTMNGGDKCLKSYQVEKTPAMDSPVPAAKFYETDVATLKEHLEWLKSLPYHIEYKDLKNDKGRHLLVTHTTAGHVWGEMDSSSQGFINSVTWERDPSPPDIKGIYNVYGHTPQPEKATVRDYFACIDTGAYYKREPYGRMTALQFPEMKVFTQDNIE